MKSLVLLTGITLFGLMSAVSIAEGAGTGLASAWLFEETSGKTVKDIVGGNDGDIKGSVERVATGKFGRALEFPGKGDSYVSIPYHDVFDSDPYTFTAWVKLEAVSWQYIAWQNGLTWPEPHTKRHLDIWVHDADYVVIMWSAEGLADYGRVDGKTIVADGSWHHVAKSSDGKVMKLFIDGKLDGENPIGGKLVVNGEDALWIGARPGDVAATGLFDEVGFFTAALSEAELAQVMTDGLASYAAVSPAGKLAAIWGEVKAEAKTPRK
jgi:hypothetical protein